MSQSQVIVIAFAFIILHASFIAYLGKSLIYNPPQQSLSDASIPDLLIRTPHGFRIKGVNESLFDCSPVVSLGEVGTGWQKEVHSLSNFSVAKVPRLFGPAHQECLNNGFGHEICRGQILDSIAQEIRWLYKLKSIPGIVNIISYCVPPTVLNNLSGLRVVVEKGVPLTSLSLVQFSWKRRKKIIEEILHMLLILKEYSFLDFRRQQFVLVDGKAKLSDVDHLQHSPYEDSFMAVKFSQEFLPFILTSDAPPLFHSAANQLNSSLFALRTLFFSDYTSVLSGSKMDSS